MESEPPAARGLTWSEISAALLRRRWLIACIVAVSTVITFVVSSVAPERYRASATLLVTTSAVQGPLDQPLLITPERAAADQSQLATSRAVAERVVERLGLEESPADVADDVSASTVPGSSLVVVTAERDTAQGAAALANATVDAYVLRQEELYRRDVANELAVLREQLERLPAGAAGSERRRVLREVIARLSVADAVAPVQARPVDEAVPPEDPSSPRPLRDALFALAISLLLAAALALGLELLERRRA